MKRTEEISIFISFALGIEIGISVVGCFIVESNVLFIVFWIFAVIAIVALVLNILCIPNDKKNES